MTSEWIGRRRWQVNYITQLGVDKKFGTHSSMYATLKKIKKGINHITNKCTYSLFPNI